ncbi:MAG: hypothetical protein H6566_15900 [Lewinellaceae bacterium]|nr:hypothetical protein [Lewinellaceae bacterium]
MEDNTLPGGLCQDVTVQLDGSGSATLSPPAQWTRARATPAAYSRQCSASSRSVVGMGG